MLTQSSYIPAFAGEEPTISVSSVSGKSDDYVYVDVTMENNPGVTNVTLTLSYDSTYLKLVDVEEGNVLPGACYDKKGLGCPFTLVWANDLATSNFTDNGVLATLKFLIKSAPNGGATLPLQISYNEDNYEIIDWEMHKVHFTCVSGTCTIACPHSNTSNVGETAATCTVDGNYAHVKCDDCEALLNAEGAEISASDVVIPMLGHDLGDAACTTPASCRRSGCDYVSGTPLGHDWTKKVEDAAHLRHAAEDCSEFDSYWYTCSRCDAISTEEYFSSTNAGQHRFTSRTEEEAYLVPGSGADCQHPYAYYVSCADCGTAGTETFNSEQVGEHQLSTAWTTENGSHYHICQVSGCTYTADSATCSGGTATCTQKAVCAVCQQPYGELAVHSFAESWSMNQEGHWHACSACGAIDESIPHTPDREEPTEENPVVCTVCGYIIRSNKTRITLSAPETDIMSGKSVMLNAAFTPANEPVDIVWSLAEGDEAFASVNALGKVTAKTVYEQHVITVYADAKDGEGVGDSIQLTIHPYTAAISLSRDGKPVVLGSTVAVDVNSTDSVTFCADCLPAGTMGEITWTTSDKKGTYGTFLDNGDGTCTVSGLHLPSAKAATVTLTAKTDDGSKKTASVKLSLIGAPTAVTILNGSTQIQDTVTIRGGASLSLKAGLSAVGYLTDKNVVWSLGQAKDSAYASISSAGKLTTFAVNTPAEITVVAAAKANSAVRTSISVRLVPAAASAAISCADAPVQNGVILTTSNSVQLIGSTLPESALQTGTWKSSSNSIAKFEGNGLLVFKKAGEVKVTFTANDGSNKSASVKVRYGVPVSGIALTCADVDIVSGGKTTVKAAVNTDASYKTLKWSSSNPSVATVSSTGVVTAKTVYKDEIVQITAAAQDGSGVSESMNILVSPKGNVLTIWYQGQPVNGKTIYTEVTESSCTFTAEAGAVWTSSSKSVADFNENGTLRFEKTGTVTVTAKSLDGKRTGKVTVKVANLVKEVTVKTKDGKTEAILGAGKGKVQLAATVSPSNATLKTLTWVSDKPEIASVSSSGLVTAKGSVEKAETVCISAVPKDGSSAVGTFQITVIPSAQTVTLSSNVPMTTQDGITVRAHESLNNRTLVLDIEAVRTLDLAAEILPGTASQNATWKTSSSNVAEVKDGIVTLKNTGAVTITATAQDGSAKSGSLKLNLVRYAKSIDVTNVQPISVGSGCKQTLTYNLVTVDGKAPSSKAVTFSLRPQDAAYASISTTGVITAKSVTAKHEIVVSIASKENPTVFTRVTVNVMPKVTAMDITFGNEVVTGKTMTTVSGNSIVFGTRVLPSSACQNVVWSVSGSAAEIHQDGTVIALKAGTVTVTAKAADGSGKTATVKLTIS